MKKLSSKTNNSFLSLLPYLWPDDLSIRFRVLFSLICLLLGKIIALLIPIIYKRAIDDLNNNLAMPILLGILLSYGAARIFSQLFNELRDSVFTRVGQRATRIVALNVFKHLHELSLHFHITRKTGGLSRSIERGTKGIETILRYSIFNIIPTNFEIILVCSVLWYAYGASFALITICTMAAYIVYTLWISEWRISFVRQLNEADNQANTKAIDSLLNFETVKYFCNENYEANRYNNSLRQYEEAAVKTMTSLSVLNIGQSIIISLGLVAVMFLASMGVKNNTMTVGDFVLVNTYLIQVSIPLFMLGFAYREIKSAVINMDDMFKLLNIPSEIQDQPNASILLISKGVIHFENVCFAYDPARPILNNINFTVESGKTLAIVGKTGSGKSTIARLLFRLYDVTGGKIAIDGQSITGVTQNSLRHSIGIVPQDTVLFNDTIYYNISYGSPDASREEVISAAIRAHIHEFIISLPDAYNSMVGERGLKLSGGEKQRVAIARTILKQPAIYLFDEATSALDSNTEKDIQASLKEISRDKTTIIIAHRLSTIIDADEIIVIDNGNIAERGTHKTLLANGGLYARLWYKQQEEMG